jgi:TonB family protein
MARYLLISSAVNFILFSLLSLMLYKSSQISESFLQRSFNPLLVYVTLPKSQPRKFPQFEETHSVRRKKNTSRAVQRTVKQRSKGSQNRKTQPVSEQRFKPQRSLIKSLLPEVKRELAASPSVRRLKASVEISGSGKAKVITNRKVIYVPPVKPIKTDIPPSPVVARITVLPDGRVVAVVFLKRSGNAKVDTYVLNFLKNLRFSPIDRNEIDNIEVKVRFTF